MTDSDTTHKKSIESTDIYTDDAYLARLEKVAKIMASSSGILPSFYTNESNCFAVAMIASQWGMNPFGVGAKSYMSSNGIIAYEAQLIHAVILSKAPIKGRPKYEFIGEWKNITGNIKKDVITNGSPHEKTEYYFSPGWSDEDEQNLAVKMTVELLSGHVIEQSLLLTQCLPRFSSQWTTDPEQQIIYAITTKMARRHFPDIILGVSTIDEVISKADSTFEPKIPGSTISENDLSIQLIEAGKDLTTVEQPTLGTKEPNKTKSTPKTRQPKIAASENTSNSITTSVSINEPPLITPEPINQPEPQIDELPKEPDNLKLIQAKFIVWVSNSLMEHPEKDLVLSVISEYTTAETPADFSNAQKQAHKVIDVTLRPKLIELNSSVQTRLVWQSRNK